RNYKTNRLSSLTRTQGVTMSSTTSEAHGKYPVQISDEEWRARLSPEEYMVLRQAGTERPGTGELLYEDRDGLYTCRGCGNELFVAGTKFDAGCGWPSFYESVREGA